MSINGINSAMPPMGPPPGAKPPSAAEMTSEIMSAQDTNADGALGVQESGLTQETFDSLDTNEDGVVSQDELVASLTEKLEAMRDKMGPPPMGPPPGQSVDATEGPSDLERLLGMMNEAGTSGTDSSGTGEDIYTKVLQEIGVSTEDQLSFFKLLENNRIDFEA